MSSYGLYKQVTIDYTHRWHIATLMFKLEYAMQQGFISVTSSLVQQQLSYWYSKELKM